MLDVDFKIIVEFSLAHLDIKVHGTFVEGSVDGVGSHT
jgi:hypothetical protein